MLGTRYRETRALRTSHPGELCERLLKHFTTFQLKAKSIHEHVEATRAPMDTWLHPSPCRVLQPCGCAVQECFIQDVLTAEQMLLDYAESLAREFAAGRDELLSFTCVSCCSPREFSLVGHIVRLSDEKQ